MTKTTFRVTNMHCSACAMALEGLEDELPGVKRLNASFHKQQVEVEFDETMVTMKQIVEAVRELGYSPEVNGRRSRKERAMRGAPTTRTAQRAAGDEPVGQSTQSQMEVTP